MPMFDKVRWEVGDANILADFESLQGRNWSTSHVYVENFRKRLLELQNYRCAYCQVPLGSDENGQRELDHVLPKNRSSQYDQAKAISSILEDRFHTDGYAAFTWLSINVVLTCKPCNTSKGSFDARRDRIATAATYPLAKDIIWFHPQRSRYTAHIDLKDMLLYVGKTRAGRTVIKVCKLDQVAVVEKKFLSRANAQLAQALNRRSALKLALDSVENNMFGYEHAMRAICEGYGIPGNLWQRVRDLSGEALGRHGSPPDATKLLELQNLVDQYGR